MVVSAPPMAHLHSAIVCGDGNVDAASSAAQKLVPG